MKFLFKFMLHTCYIFMFFGFYSSWQTICAYSLLPFRILYFVFCVSVQIYSFPSCQLSRSLGELPGRVYQLCFHRSHFFCLLPCVLLIKYHFAVYLSNHHLVLHALEIKTPTSGTVRASLPLRWETEPRGCGRFPLGEKRSSSFTTTIIIKITIINITTMIIITNISPSSPPMLGLRRSSPTPATCTRPSSTRHPRHCSPPQALTG